MRLRTAVQSRLDRTRAQYRAGSLSAAEFAAILTNLPYTPITGDDHGTKEEKSTAAQSPIR